MSRQNIEDLRERTSRMYHRIRGMVRRVTISLTGNTGQWQAQGYRGIGADDVEGEKFDQVEVFPGIGISARPKAGGRPEAVIVHVGGESGHPVIVATRDRSLELALEEDETAIWNSVSAVIVKKDGTIEIRTRTGSAGPVAMKADMDSLRTWVAAQFTGPGHVHGVSGAVTNSTTPVAAPAVTPPAVVGSQKVKVE